MVGPDSANLQSTILTVTDCPSDVD
jgi:hypothetical protein